MRTALTWAEVFSLLRDCPAVLVDNNVVCPLTCYEADAEEAQHVRVQYYNKELEFWEEENPRVPIGYNMELRSRGGGGFYVGLLHPIGAEQALNKQKEEDGKTN